MPTDIQARLLALTSPFAAELVRLARAEGHAAGLATGLERGRREAQTEIDGLTYAKGQEDERARCEAIVRGPISRGDMLAAIRSGEPAPEAK
jgi:hypothetical protein